MTPTNERLRILTGDITTLQVDAIVNAANSTLLGGGGVDGAIHRAAGAKFLEACRRLGGCRTGEAVWTPGFDLPASSVIHTVGPVWHGGDQSEDALLANCYSNSLRLASEKGIKSLAFPAISCGAYGYPHDLAARIALRETMAHLALHELPDRVIFCCFDMEMQRLLCDTLDDLCR